jgi:hypothetical protein
MRFRFATGAIVLVLMTPSWNGLIMAQAGGGTVSVAEDANGRAVEGAKLGHPASGATRHGLFVGGQGYDRGDYSSGAIKGRGRHGCAWRSRDSGFCFQADNGGQRQD